MCSKKEICLGVLKTASLFQRTYNRVNSDRAQKSGLNLEEEAHSDFSFLRVCVHLCLAISSVDHLVAITDCFHFLC